MKIMSKLTMEFIAVAIIVLALSGCTGPAGVQGPVGQQGPAGSVGAVGVSVTGASVNSTGHLVLALSDGQTIDAGSISNTQNAVVNLPSFAGLISTAKPSVVEINVTATIGSGRRTVQQQGAGSGWILDANGTIVTNNHVVTGATTITVTTSEGKMFPAQVINTEPATD